MKDLKHRRSRTIIIITTIVILLAAFYLTLNQNQNRTDTQVMSALQDTISHSDKVDGSIGDGNGDNGNNPLKVENIPNIQEEDIEYLDSLKEAFSEAALEYEKTMTFPPDSVPVFDPTTVETPQPYTQSSVSLRLPDSNGSLLPLEIFLASEKPHYSRGQTLKFKLRLIGIKANEKADVAIKVLNDKNELASFGLQTMTRSLNDKQEWYAELDSESLPNSTNNQWYTAKAYAKVGGNDYAAAVQFTMGGISASLTGIGQAAPIDEYLVIPLQFKVDQKGYYFVSGVLDDKETQKPLVELQAEGQMDSKNNTLILKAHQAALKFYKSEGPYVLRILTGMMRPPPQLNTADTPIELKTSRFDIPKFSFDQYKEIDYQNEHSEASLEIIRGLSRP